MNRINDFFGLAPSPLSVPKSWFSESNRWKHFIGGAVLAFFMTVFCAIGASMERIVEELGLDRLSRDRSWRTCRSDAANFNNISHMEIVKHNLRWLTGLIKRRSTDKIVIHCTASREGSNYSVEQCHQDHQRNGWAGIGYNFLVYRDGSVHEGRPENCVGAHCPPYNHTSIGICYVGGVGSDGKAKDTRTPAQVTALYELVHYVMGKYNIDINDVHAHNEYCSKACPSFKIESFREGYRNFYLQDKENIK